MPTVKDDFSVANPEALAMLRISKRDWKAASGMTAIEVFEEVIWGFQLQQAIEKALKAWLYGLGEKDVPFTHDLVLLMKQLRAVGADITAFQSLSPFTDFAVQLRYDEDPEPQHLDREACNAEVAALITHVEERIGRSV
jgi:HEPN domain-containing protein